MSSVVLITERKGQILSLQYLNQRLLQVKVHEKTAMEGEASDSKLSSEKSGSEASLLSVGSIYIGKVKNVVPAIDAAFVELKKGSMGFLPLKNAKEAVITNRTFDGRILMGDEILVQIEKEGIKTKDPGLTCNLSFTGKYLVLTTGKQTLGFSSKLSPEIKETWKEKIQSWGLTEILKKEKTGMVLRTNVSSLPKETAQEEKTAPAEGMNVTAPKENRFLEEFEQLLTLKNKVMEEAMHRTCFSCLFQPAEGFLTDIRDCYEASYDKILTDIPWIYNRIREEFPAMEQVALYQDPKISLAKLYSVETRLKEALAEKVWLKSGAYLVIQQTEALTVIDVNSGKIQKKHPKDDIYHEINKEAAQEIALQLQLRNLSGIIVIDFISQNTKQQDERLVGFLQGIVKQDPVKTTVVDMTPLGLVEVTRKKIHKSLKEQLR